MLQSLAEDSRQDKGTQVLGQFICHRKKTTEVCFVVLATGKGITFVLLIVFVFHWSTNIAKGI